MIIQRTAAGPIPNAAATAGSAMLRDASRETSRAPRAASTTGAGIRRVYSRAPAVAVRAETGPRADRRSAAREEVAKGGGRGREGQIRPGNRVRRDPLHLVALMTHRDRAAEHARTVDDDRDGRRGIRVDADDAAELHPEARLLVRLADRRHVHRLAPVHVAAGERPLAMGRMDGTPGEEDAPVRGGDGAGDDLRAQVVNEITARADHLALAVGRDGAPLESLPTQRAESDAPGGEMRLLDVVAHLRRTV